MARKRTSTKKTGADKPPASDGPGNSAMKFELKQYNRGRSDAELLADLSRVARVLGKPTVTANEYCEHGIFHSSTLQRRFGSWFKALERANLKRSRVLGITDEELFENLQNVWVSLGRQPVYGDITKPSSKFCAGTYERRFGSWRKALEAFVAFVNSDGPLPAESEQPSQHKPRRTSRQVNLRLRFRVLLRDNFRCVACGRSPATEAGVKLEVDHIKPWSKGGETVVDNLQALCTKCNGGKSNIH